MRKWGMTSPGNDEYSDAAIGGLGSGPRYRMGEGIYMTRVDFTDPYAAVPGADEGVGAWCPLSYEQRSGWACIDCAATQTSALPFRPIGSCDDGQVFVCLTCYEQRLRDHIDYYRPSP